MKLTDYCTSLRNRFTCFDYAAKAPEIFSFPDRPLCYQRFLGAKLCEWHSAMGDPIYALGSTIYAGHSAPIEYLEDAIYNLRGSYFGCELRGETEQCKELSFIVASLLNGVINSTKPEVQALVLVLDEDENPTGEWGTESAKDASSENLYSPPEGTDGIELAENSGAGIYIPRNFAESSLAAYYPQLAEYAQDLADPDNEYYQDTWIRLLDNFEIQDDQGNTWQLYQDADLFLVCYGLISDERYEEFFGEERQD
jgi:hypothetical protein